jgi:tRNA(adenine34) deaminase
MNNIFFIEHMCFGSADLRGRIFVPADLRVKEKRVLSDWTLSERVATTYRMIQPPDDERFMREALRQAKKAYDADEVPVGAVVVRQGKIIGRAYNQVELLKDATAHAEMLALTQAEAAMGDWRLTNCDLYVTKEPCPMCAGALVHVRIRRVIFGCADPRAGAAGSVLNLLQTSTLNHQCEITAGILQSECAEILQHFFRRKRASGGCR